MNILNSKTSETVCITAMDSWIFMTSNSAQRQYTDTKKFLADIPKLFKNVKAVILNVFQYHPTGSESNMEFCEIVKEKLDSLKIKQYFDSMGNTAIAMSFIFKNIACEIGENVFYILVFPEYIKISEYEITKIGYKLIDNRDMEIDLKENAKTVGEKIFGSTNPKKILLYSDTSNTQLFKFMKNVLKSDKLIVLELPIQQPSDERRNEIFKWLFDKRFVKYYILPTAIRSYFISMNVGAEEVLPLIMVEAGSNLPFCKSITLPRKNGEITYGYAEHGDVMSGTREMSSTCHQNKFTLTVDAENFMYMKHERIMFPEIDDLIQNLDTKNDMQIPVVALMNEISFVCIHRNGGYKFLDSWNGYFGRENAISFDQEKPRFCDDAFNGLYQKPESIVYDLITIMSMPADKITISENWKFTFTKNSDNPVLLEFDNFDGTKKAASPAFLMAMILKEQIKAIKKETNEKPKKLAFCLFDNFKPEERKRVEDGIRTACELLKTDCIFKNV